MSNEAGAKISGYLEKKGKLRMVSSWKKYWFVLEGRLLLYYRSRAEYEAISPCKGSITLGPPCNIKPALASTCIFQIETRSNTIILRAENRYEQDKWMHAILGALNLSSVNQTKMTHFRYSADDLVTTPSNNKTKKQKPVLSRQNTMPDRLKETVTKEKNIIQRLQTLGAHSYGETTNKSSPKLPKNKNLKKMLEKSEQNTIYAQIKGNSEPTRSDKETRESVMVENVDYVSVDVSTVGSKKEHIYHEIITPNCEVIVENAEYVTTEAIYAVPNTVDHNDNKLAEEGADKKENKIYAEVDIEPDLPPRPKNDEDTSSQSSNDNKPKKISKLKKLAKLVHESKKDGSKRQSFVVRVLKKMRKGDGEEAKQDQIEILNELQKVLTDRKHEIEEKHSEMLDDRNVIEHKYPAEYNLVNTINIPRPKLIPKMKKMDDKLKTIDEILDDLEATHAERVERRDEVLLDDDLNQLLEALQRVTSAPILQPGATCSLITTMLEDEELKALVPQRKRRMSEPDYDVPRPHSSLQVESEIRNENAMEPTRFFGPVLATPDNKINFSITPDSLEFECDRKQANCSSIEEDRSLYSYASHNYAKEIEDRKLKAHITLDLPKNECEHMKIKQQHDLDGDEYQDSLEFELT